MDWINRSISSRIVGSVISARLMVCGRIVGSVISARLMVCGLGLGVRTKKELIEWSDGGFVGGFVVGCVSRSSSGVFKAMVNCDDIGREDCGCDVGWKD